MIHLHRNDGCISLTSKYVQSQRKTYWKAKRTCCSTNGPRSKQNELAANHRNPTRGISSRIPSQIIHATANKFNHLEIVFKWRVTIICVRPQRCLYVDVCVILAFVSSTYRVLHTFHPCHNSFVIHSILDTNILCYFLIYYNSSPFWSAYITLWIWRSA